MSGIINPSSGTLPHNHAATDILEPAWNDLPLNSPWINYAGFQPAQYRKKGNQLQMRGLIKVSTPVSPNAGNAIIIATLPSGFRPSAIRILPVKSQPLTDFRTYPEGFLLIVQSVQFQASSDDWISLESFLEL